MKADVGPRADEPGMGLEPTDAQDEIRPARWGRRTFFLLVVVVAAGTGWMFTRSGDTAGEPTSASQPTFAEVVRTDLVEKTSYDGTLGRAAGDSLSAASPGTLTWLPAPGQTVSQGDVVFAIDTRPTVLLFGEVPMYRTLARSATDVTVASRTAGTITAIPEVGTVVEQGDVLFEVDGLPVVALYGDTPAYRRMSDQNTNLTGPDIAQLERALDTLGFVSVRELTVDDVFTGATASVVEQWQASIGAPEDGSVDLGEVVFIPGPTEVSSVSFSVGDSVGNGQPVLSLAGTDPMTGPDVAQMEVALSSLGFDAAGTMGVDDQFTVETAAAVKDFETAYGLTVDGRLTRDEILFAESAVRISTTLQTRGGSVNQGSPVLAVTGEQTIVTMNLPAADQGTLEEGMPVTVELPDGTEATATVTSVATVATVSGNDTVFEIEVELDDPTVAAGLDEAPVNVNVVTDSVENVMAVPVAALLALAEGGYAVEVDAGGGQTRLVAVEPGFFADGLVEVIGDGLHPGDFVVIP